MFVLLPLAAAAAASFLPAEGGAARLAQLFATPTASLEIPVGEDDDYSLADLLDEYAHVTGIHVSASTPTANALAATPVGLTDTLVVRAEAVHAVVQGLLCQHGFAVSALHTAQPGIAWIVSPHLDGGLRPPAIPIDASDVALLDDYPACLVSVAMSFEGVDARVLPTLMRPLIDYSMSRMVAFGPELALFSGRAVDVQGWIGALRAAEAAAGASREVAASPATVLPESALAALSDVLETVAQVESDAGAFELRKLDARPADGGTCVTLDLDVLAADELAATQRFYTLLSLLRAKPWCDFATDSGTSAREEGGIRTQLTVCSRRAKAAGEPTPFAGGVEEPFTTLRALAARPGLLIGPLDIEARRRDESGELPIESLRFGSAGREGTSLPALLGFLREVERELDGCRITELRTRPATAERSESGTADVVFEARVVWRAAD